MQLQARQDTGIEIALRRMLHARGFRYRTQWPVPGLPRRRIDVAFPGRRLAVAVHGCWWHGCTEHGEVPATNASWWQSKIGRNRARDAETRSHLEALGWAVIEVWEHEETALACERITAAIEIMRSSDRDGSQRAARTS